MYWECLTGQPFNVGCWIRTGHFVVVAMFVRRRTQRTNDVRAFAPDAIFAGCRSLSVGPRSHKLLGERRFFLHRSGAVLRFLPHPCYVGLVFFFNFDDLLMRKDDEKKNCPAQNDNCNFRDTFKLSVHHHISGSSASTENVLNLRQHEH